MQRLRIVLLLCTMHVLAELGVFETKRRHLYQGGIRMTALEAMNEVNGFLNDGNVVGAQAAVVAIENEGSVLPSCVFERVLKEAVTAGKLATFYADFCKRAYGEDIYRVICTGATAKAFAEAIHNKLWG